MKINASPKLFWLLTGSVFLIGSGAIYMTNSANGETETRITSLEAEVKDEKSVRAELVASEEKVAQLEKDLRHLEGGIPEAAYIPTLLGELEKSGNANKVKILSVKPVMDTAVAKDAGAEKKKGASAYVEQNIQVKGRGSYGDALRFVAALKRFPKIVAVRQFSATPRADNARSKSSVPLLDIDIELRAFAYKQDQMKAGQRETKDES